MKSKTKESSRELQEEMVGILTAISIVSKRLAGRLLKADINKPGLNDNQTAENDEIDNKPKKQFQS